MTNRKTPQKELVRVLAYVQITGGALIALGLATIPLVSKDFSAVWMILNAIGVAILVNAVPIAKMIAAQRRRGGERR